MATILSTARTPPIVQASVPSRLAGLILTAASVALFFINTRHGIGIRPDSTAALGMFVETYDAPLYPLVLQAVASLGVDIVQAAKIVGLILVATNTALIWHLLIRTTGRMGLSTLGTALIVFSPQFVSWHAAAMSEPLFLFFVLVTLLAFLRYLATERWGWLLACSALIALCTLVRFTAPPLGMAIVATLLLIPRHPFRHRLGRAAALSLVSGGLFLGWCAYSEAVTGKSIGRELRLLGNIGPAELRTALESMSAWLLPDQVPLLLRSLLLAAVLSGALVLGVRQSRLALDRARHEPVVEALLPTVLGLFIPLYLGFLVLATAIEHNLVINSRYAFPAQVALFLLLTMLAADLRARGGLRGGSALVAAASLTVLVIGAHVARTAIRTYDAYQNGIGYAGLTWTRSPTIGALATLPASTAIWSNGSDVMAYVLRRRVEPIPSLVRPRTGEPDPAKPYAVEIAKIGARLARHPGYVVFLDGVDWRFYHPREADLVRELDLRLVARQRDGRIYTAGRRPHEPGGIQ